jgi:DNA-binding CsgD family transcriptional regulator
MSVGDSWRWRSFVEAGCAAVQAAGQADFPDAVDRWINAMLPVDSIAIFAFSPQFRASHVFTVGRLGPGVGEHLARDYTERFAGIDPAWRRSRDGERGAAAARGAARDRVVGLDTHGDYTETYRDHFFARHALVDKAAIIQSIGTGFLYCNFYRMERSGRFSRREWRILPVVLPQIASAVALHVTRAGARRSAGAEAWNGPLASYVVQDLNDPGRGPFRLLAAREREVCYRTLLGLTAEGIARDLSISASTVITYRRRAYEKLGITTQKELFGLFLQRGRERP